MQEQEWYEVTVSRELLREHGGNAYYVLRKEVVTWLYEHVGSEPGVDDFGWTWFLEGKSCLSFKFRSKEQALLFKLVWG